MKYKVLKDWEDHMEGDIVNSEDINPEIEVANLIEDGTLEEVTEAVDPATATEEDEKVPE